MASRSATRRESLPKRAYLFVLLVVAELLLSAHRSTGRRSSLDRALRLLDRSDLDPSQRSFGRWPEWCTNLAFALAARWDLDHQIADLDRAIAIAGSVVADWEQHQTRSKETYGVSQGNLGNFLRKRFLDSGSIDDLHASIAATELGRTQFAPGSPHYIGFTNNVVAHLAIKYEMTGDEEIATEMVRMMSEVVDDTSPLDDQYSIRRGNLGALLAIVAHHRNLHGTPDDALSAADEAVLHLTEALGIVRTPTAAAASLNAASAEARLEQLIARRSTGRPSTDEELDEVIDLFRIAATGGLSPSDAAEIEADFARALEVRIAGRPGQPELTDAIAHIEDAIERTSKALPRYREYVTLRDRLRALQ